MLRQVCAPPLAPSSEKRGNALPRGEMDAEHWGEAAGRTPRMAKYWLASGDVSAEGKLAIVRVLAH